MSPLQGLLWSGGWVGLGPCESIMAWIGLGLKVVGLGSVGWCKMDPCPSMVEISYGIECPSVML